LILPFDKILFLVFADHGTRVSGAIGFHIRWPPGDEAAHFLTVGILTLFAHPIGGVFTESLICPPFVIAVDVHRILCESRKVVIMPGSRAFCASKKDVLGVVNARRVDIDDRILSAVVLSILHLLLGALAMAKGFTRSALLCAVLTSS
jgi:hypothetical protein